MPLFSAEAASDLLDVTLDAPLYFSCDVSERFPLHDQGAFVGFFLSARDTKPKLDHAAFIIH